MDMDHDQEGQEQPKTYSPELIDEAKRMGWVDRSEWRGKPELWREPDEYVRRGHEVVPIMRAELAREREANQRKEQEFAQREREFAEQIRRQEERQREFEAKLERQKREFDERTTRNDNIARLAIARQRQTFLEQIDAAKRHAVEAGDAARYDSLVAREQQFYAQAQREDETYQRAPERNEETRTSNYQQQTQQTQSMPQRDIEIRDRWIENNSWFSRSQELNVEAQRIHMEIWERYPGLDLKENLERVSQEIKKRHPEKFGLDANPASREVGLSRQDNLNSGYSQESQQRQFQEGNQNDRNDRNDSSQRQYSNVEGGNSGSASYSASSRRKGWEDIHPDDRRLAEESYIRTGFYGADTAKAREAYARDYWEDYRE